MTEIRGKVALERKPPYRPTDYSTDCSQKNSSAMIGQEVATSDDGNFLDSEISSFPSFVESDLESVNRQTPLPKPPKKPVPKAAAKRNPKAPPNYNILKNQIL